MAPAVYLEAAPGERILDLCAAPGGKTTQIASYMQNQGLLVCNEIHPARAKILSENVERMGIRNALVTNETPQRLAEVFDGYTLVTSHTSSKFLPGILIGYVSEITIDANNLTKSGYVTPVVDFEHLEYVLVITEQKQTD